MEVREGRERRTFLTGAGRPPELLLFGGKGGVGKTTCAAATALAFALDRPGISHLLVSTDPAHSLMDCFAGSAVPENLGVLELDAGEACAAFKRQHYMTLRELARRGTFFDDEDVCHLMELSLPGLDELMAFLEIASIVEEERHGCIVVDTAPMGHTLRLLAMPGVLWSWLHAADALMAKHRFMRKRYSGADRPDHVDVFLEQLAGSIARGEELLRDRSRCLFVPVLVPEDLVIRETLKLLDELRRLEVPVREMVVNRLYVKSECPECEGARTRQIDQLRLNLPEFADYEIWAVPVFAREVRGERDLRRFAGSLEPLPDLSRIRPEPLLPARGALDGPVDHQFAVTNPMELASPEMKLLLFAGKGGVGKTTLACATAVCRASEMPQGRLLLVSMDPAHSLSTCLGTSVGATPVQVSAGLWAVELDAQEEFVALKREYSREVELFFDRALPTLDLPFDRPAIEQIIALTPSGVDEVMGLIRAIHWLEEGSYDLLILDCAPTGHLIRLLEMPKLLDEWLKASFGLLLKYRDVLSLPGFAGRLVQMSKMLKSFVQVLPDPQKAQLNCVSVLTEMAYEETKDLRGACERLRVPFNRLFLNMATAPSPCPLCMESHQREALVLDRFRRDFSSAAITLVSRSGEPRGLGMLLELGRSLYLPHPLTAHRERRYA